MPKVVTLGRRQVCKSCPTQCVAFKAGQIDHTSPGVCCPLPAPRWGTWEQVKTFGAGDLFAVVATPIARALRMDCIDAATEQLKPESPCNQKKRKLNKVIPDLRRPFSRSEKQPLPGTGGEA